MQAHAVATRQYRGISRCSPAATGRVLSCIGRCGIRQNGRCRSRSLVISEAQQRGDERQLHLSDGPGEVQQCNEQSSELQRANQGSALQQGQQDGVQKPRGVDAQMTRDAEIEEIVITARDARSMALKSLQDVPWGPTLAVLAVAGALLGPPLDAFHSRVDLLVYDKLPVTLGPWKTSLLDAPLLASYYTTAGALALALDRLWPTLGGRPRPHSTARVAWHVGLLAIYLQLSAVMYQGGAPPIFIWITLGALGYIGWFVTDGTKQGAAMGLLAAMVCPLAEVVLMATAHVWHYPQGDLRLLDGPSITSWVACCYAYYTMTLAGVARWLAARLTPPSDAFRTNSFLRPARPVVQAGTILQGTQQESERPANYAQQKPSGASRSGDSEAPSLQGMQDREPGSGNEQRSNPGQRGPQRTGQAPEGFPQPAQEGAPGNVVSEQRMQTDAQPLESRSRPAQFTEQSKQSAPRDTLQVPSGGKPGIPRRSPGYRSPFSPIPGVSNLDKKPRWHAYEARDGSWGEKPSEGAGARSPVVDVEAQPSPAESSATESASDRP